VAAAAASSSAAARPTYPWSATATKARTWARLRSCTAAGPRERFVQLHLAAADAADLPDDAPFREALRSHVEFGSRVAQQNSHAVTDAEVHSLRHVPIWTWQPGHPGHPEPGAGPAQSGSTA
jgi:hypothetical protein